MKPLLFKNWLLKEFADFGFDQDQRGKPQGGTETVSGETVFKPLDGSKIITELAKLPAIGPNTPFQKWQDSVEWGNGPGAIQVGVTPLGSMRIVVRRKISDLYGESCWICTDIVPLGDNESENKEISIAQDVYNKITEQANEMIPSPLKKFEEFDRLCWRLWSETKKKHPSYIMFPLRYVKQNENYYKLVYEFRGHGVMSSKKGRPHRAEQFNIDMIWDENKGLVRCLGYNIDSTLGQHSWKVQPPEFEEYFSPTQDKQQIIENITKIFLQY
jgi:hypothetical protein